MAAKALSGSLQFSSNLEMAVDFAIVADDEAPVGGMHRLAAGGRQIDDGQAAVDQRDPGIMVKPDVVAVWSAMRQASIHRICDTNEIVRGYAPIWIDDASYA